MTYNLRMQSNIIWKWTIKRIELFENCIVYIILNELYSVANLNFLFDILYCISHNSFAKNHLLQSQLIYFGLNNSVDKICRSYVRLALLSFFSLVFSQLCPFPLLYCNSCLGPSLFHLVWYKKFILLFLFTSLHSPFCGVISFPNSFFSTRFPLLFSPFFWFPLLFSL